MLAELTLTRRQFHGLALTVAWAVRPRKPRPTPPPAGPAYLSGQPGLGLPGAFMPGAVL